MSRAELSAIQDAERESFASPEGGYSQDHKACGASGNRIGLQ